MEREKTQLEQEYDTLSMRVAVKQMDYEEADERLKRQMSELTESRLISKLKAILWWI